MTGFCGQCKKDDDCGVAHKCCGPDDCRQCFKVDTCPADFVSRQAIWGFAATNARGERYLFGPYPEMTRCIEARNAEAQKVKWSTIGACEENFPINDFPDCLKGCKNP